MIIKNAVLDIVCGVTSTLPDTGMPEVAFAGKSNVGKSSLINGLMNRKALARTSAQPGKTQTINFYKINDEMFLVDLPGYGYAKITPAEKEKWHPEETRHEQIEVRRSTGRSPAIHKPQPGSRRPAARRSGKHSPALRNKLPRD